MMKRIMTLGVGVFVVLSAATQSIQAQYGERSTRDQALIIAVGTAGGAVLGSVIGGSKGALAGAIAGGAGSTVYNQATKVDPEFRAERSAVDKLVIIGGSAGAGAAVGGITAGTKGALIGAAIGGTGGYILHKATENRDRYYQDRYYQDHYYRDRYNRR